MARRRCSYPRPGTREGLMLITRGGSLGNSASCEAVSNPRTMVEICIYAYSLHLGTWVIVRDVFHTKGSEWLGVRDGLDFSSSLEIVRKVEAIVDMVCSLRLGEQDFISGLV